MKKLEIVLSVQNLLDLGGTVKPGTKLFTHPNISMGIEAHNDLFNNIVGKNLNAKEYTFIKVVEGEGIEVEETDSYLGTAWLFTTAEVSLSTIVRKQTYKWGQDES